MALAFFIVFLALLGISSSTGDTKSLPSIKDEVQERNFGLIRPQYPNNNNPWNTGNTYPGYRPNPGSGYQPNPGYQPYPNYNQQYPNFNQQFPNFNQQYPNYNPQYPNYNPQFPNYNQQLYPANNGWNRPTGSRPSGYSG